MRIVYVTIAAILVGQAGCGRRGDPLKEALSSGRWEGFVKRDVPVILRAQTWLATNRNNQAVCAFLNADAPALAEYQQSVRELAGRFRDSAVAQYLVGDAYARSARWTEAMAAFDRALALDKRLDIALTARAVAGVSSGRMQDAEHDLYSALLIHPEFAEAQAAMGWTMLKEGRPAVAARNHFARAVELSPGYSLAEAGEGLAEVAAGNAERGAALVAGQAKPENCGAALLAEDSLLAAAWLQSDGDGKPEDAPGTEITIQQIKAAFTLGGMGDRKAFNYALRILGADPHNPFLNALATNMLTNLEKHPELAGNLLRDLPSNAHWTRTEGPAVILLSAVRNLYLPLAGIAASRFPGGVAAAAILTPAIQDRLRQQEFNTHTDNAGQTKALEILNHFPQTAQPRIPPGGANTSLERARLDRGAAPFEPVFGLLYPHTKGGH